MYGGIDFVRTPISSAAAYAPQLAALQLPYEYTSDKHLFRVLDGAVGQQVMASLGTGATGLSYFLCRLPVLFHDRRRKRSPADRLRRPAPGTGACPGVLVRQLQRLAAVHTLHGGQDWRAARSIPQRTAQVRTIGAKLVIEIVSPSVPTAHLTLTRLIGISFIRCLGSVLDMLTVRLHESMSSSRRRSHTSFALSISMCKGDEVPGNIVSRGKRSKSQPLMPPF